MVYWLAWPVWFVYFRIYSDRSRVFVVSEGKILLVKSWLSDESWGLPGGGAKAGEPIELSAARELQEEVGIVVESSTLKPLGNCIHNKIGLKFRAHFFLLELPSQPQIKRQTAEISDMGWFSKTEIETMKINEDTRFGLTEYSKQVKA